MSLLSNRWAMGGLGLLLVVLMVMLARHDAYQDGRRAEAAAQQEQIAKEREEQAQLERAAEDVRQKEAATARDTAAERRKDIDDATRNIPDASPSARARARVCGELRREAKANGQPQPAC